MSKGFWLVGRWTAAPGEIRSCVLCAWKPWASCPRSFRDGNNCAGSKAKTQATSCGTPNLIRVMKPPWYTCLLLGFICDHLWYFTHFYSLNGDIICEQGFIMNNSLFMSMGQNLRQRWPQILERWTHRFLKYQSIPFFGDVPGINPCTGSTTLSQSWWFSCIVYETWLAVRSLYETLLYIYVYIYNIHVQYM